MGHTIDTKEALVEEFRRDTILRAARHVIARRGLAAASMQAIAEEARVAKGTLYLYFRDRDELLEQAAARIFEELRARLNAELAAPRPLREALRALVRTTVEFFDANQDFLRVYVEICGAEAEPCRGRRRSQFDRQVELLAGALRQAIGRGEARPFDPGRVALFIVEGTSAVMRQRLQERGRKTAEDLEWIVDLLLDGICTGGRRA